MPKINREECEVLKEVDERYEWIARDKDRGLYAFTKKPVRKYGSSPYWDTETGEPYSALDLIDEIHLFQFIQWEDEEPHDIAELIEEYERYEIENIHVERKHPMFNCNRFNGFYNANIAIWDRLEESEETEVKKNIEWLKKWLYEYEDEIGSWLGDKHTSDYFSTRLHGGLSAIKEIREKINQLDEPEVLSQEWLEENKCSWYKLKVDGYYIPVEKLQNLLVPKQELPVIPKFIADFLEKFNVIYDSCVRYLVEAHNGDFYYLNEMMVEDGDLTLDEAAKICQWAEKQKQSDLLKLINGYTVEEEQKYVIELPNITGSDERYLVQGDDGDLWIDGGLDYLQKHDLPKHTFTEEEIKSFDTKYMTFAKPVEELEE